MKLHEVGDGNNLYFSFKKIYDKKDTCIYQFITDLETVYKVFFNCYQNLDITVDDIDLNGLNNWVISFSTIDSENDIPNFDNNSNKNELYKVMSTILKIVNDFIKHCGKLDSLIYKGSDNRRDKLYQQYINKNLSNIFLDKKDKDNNTILIPKHKFQLFENFNFIKRIIFESNIPL